MKRPTPQAIRDMARRLGREDAGRYRRLYGLHAHKLAPLGTPAEQFANDAWHETMTRLAAAGATEDDRHALEMNWAVGYYAPDHTGTPPEEEPIAR